MLMIYKNSIVQFYSKNHKNIFFVVILQRFNKKHRAICSVFFITLSRKRKRELPSGSDVIADFKFKKR